MNSIGRMPELFRFWTDARVPGWFRGRGEHAHRHGRSEGAPLARTAQSTDLRAAIATKNEAAQLTIRTDEGDVVTLSASTSVEVTYASLRQRQRTQDGSSRLRADVREIQIDRSISLSVQGDLNEEELADIRALVARLQPALDGSGQDAARLASSLDASEFESLSGFEFRLERSERWLRLHVRRREFGPSPEPVASLAGDAGGPRVGEPPAEGESLPERLAA